MLTIDSGISDVSEERRQLRAFLDRYQVIVLTAGDRQDPASDVRRAIRELPSGMSQPVALLVYGLISRLTAERFRWARPLSVVCPSTATVSRNQILLAIDSGIVFSSENERDNGSRVDRALRYIRANYTNRDLSLEVVARHVGLSRYHLTRELGRVSGLTFRLHLQRIRSESSKDLLRNTDLGVKEIAALVGYAGATQLGKQFKKAYAVSPAAYRKLSRLQPRPSAISVPSAINVE